MFKILLATRREVSHAVTERRVELPRIVEEASTNMLYGKTNFGRGHGAYSDFSRPEFFLQAIKNHMTVGPQGQTNLFRRVWAGQVIFETCGNKIQSVKNKNRPQPRRPWAGATGIRPNVCDENIFSAPEYFSSAPGDPRCRLAMLWASSK